MSNARMKNDLKDTRKDMKRRKACRRVLIRERERTKLTPAGLRKDKLFFGFPCPDQVFRIFSECLFPASNNPDI